MLKSNFFKNKTKNQKNKQTKKKPKKEYKFSKPFFKFFFNMYAGLGYFVRSTYQYNSPSMGHPDKRKAARDPRFIG